jgi:hypothetical protein
MNAESHEEHERTSALPRILSLGNKEIEQGKFRDAEDVFSELDERIAEDEAKPDDAMRQAPIRNWPSLKQPLPFLPRPFPAIYEPESFWINYGINLRDSFANHDHAHRPATRHQYRR